MKNRTLTVIGGIVLSLLVAFGVRGCGHYGEVNKATYEYGKALYSICNRHDTERLKLVSGMIDSASEKEEISRTEADWLRGIVDEAKAANWDEALSMSRQLMTDQTDL